MKNIFQIDKLSEIVIEPMKMTTTILTRPNRSQIVKMVNSNIKDDLITEITKGNRNLSNSLLITILYKKKNTRTHEIKRTKSFTTHNLTRSLKHQINKLKLALVIISNLDRDSGSRKI